MNDNKIRILIVDDNEDVAYMLVRLLQVKGYLVRTAFDGEEALALVEEFRPAAIFCDVGLPGMRGYRVAKMIRQSGNDVMLVAITGWARDEDKEESRRAGFDYHLTKPFSPSALDEILAELE